MKEEIRLILELHGKIQKLTDKIVELENQIATGTTKQKWYTMEEFCNIIKVGRRTVTDRLKAGEYPWAKKNGRGWRFPAKKVEKLTSNIL